MQLIPSGTGKTVRFDGVSRVKSTSSQGRPHTWEQRVHIKGITQNRITLFYLSVSCLLRLLQLWLLPFPSLLLLVSLGLCFDLWLLSSLFLFGEVEQEHEIRDVEVLGGVVGGENHVQNILHEKWKRKTYYCYCYYFLIDKNNILGNSLNIISKMTSLINFSKAKYSKSIRENLQYISSVSSNRKSR